MAATKYTYSVQNDTPNHKVDSDRLMSEIRGSTITTFDYVEVCGDVLDIWFTSELSSGDVLLLNSLVAAHSGEPIFHIDHEMHVSCGGTTSAYFTVTDTSYKTVRKIEFDGTDNIGTPNQVIFNIEAVTGSGTCRLRDTTNNKTISFKSIDNGAKIYKDTSTSNWPTSEAMLALQIKVTTDGDSVSINEFTIGW